MSQTKPGAQDSIDAVSSKNTPEANYELAIALRDSGTLEARAEAARLFLKAAQLDHPGGHLEAAIEARALQMRWLSRAETSLYRSYLTAAKEMETDLFGLAAYHLEEALNADFEGAEELELQWKIDGFDNFRNAAEAIALLEPAAAAGNNNARYQLAVRRLRCEGSKSALALLKDAADEGHAGAICRLGICHLLGEGTDPDRKAALRCITQAADLGRSDAWLALGRVHLDSGDSREAARHFAESADLGNEDAFYQLACLQATGAGVAKDEPSSRRLMLKAAKAGHHAAAFEVGNYHLLGRRHFKRESNIAAYWYRRAARNTLYQAGTLTLFERGARKEGEDRWELRERPSSPGIAAARAALRAMIDRDEIRAEAGDDKILSEA
ncbi:MAG TPA: hypothetical protein VGL53_17440 [Bryobacteraceae bacterium]